MFLVGGGVGWQKRGLATGWMNDSVAVCGGWEGVTCDGDGQVGELRMMGWGVTALPFGIGSLSRLSYWYFLFYSFFFFSHLLILSLSLQGPRQQPAPDHPREHRQPDQPSRAVFLSFSFNRRHFHLSSPSLFSNSFFFPFPTGTSTTTSSRPSPRASAT